MNYHIDILPFVTILVQHVIWNEDKTELAGYCLITGKVDRDGKIMIKETKTATLWHIYVDQKYRRKGYARALMDSIKSTYDVIRSQALTPEGKKLLMNTGFVIDGEEDGIKNFKWEKTEQKAKEG